LPWAVVCSLFPAFACGKAEPPKPRSAILVSLDTLRADHLGCYGYARETSPHIDALAGEGILFEHAIAQATSTLPSHRSLFQSRPASRIRSRGLTLAQTLSRRGLKTAAFTGGGNVAGKLGLGAGFDVYGEYPEGLSAAYPEMERWLRRNGGAPFFLFLHTYDVHLPYDPPPPFDTLYYPEYPGSVTGRGTRDLLRKIRRLPSKAGESLVSDEDREKIVALYDGGIRYTDEFIGRLRGLLHELGLEDDTVVVLLSDHGEELWDHGSVIHAHALYEEQVRVPLIWRLPESEFPGRRVSATVRLLDVAPTLLDLLGVEAPEDFLGESLLPVLRGSETPALSALSEIRLLKSWTSFPWKLHTDQRSGRARLFHLERDPEERTDVSDDNPEVVSALRSQMRAYLEGRTSTDVPEIEPGIEDEELLKQLRALGYVP